MLKRLKWMSLLVLVFVCLIMASCTNDTINTPNTPDNTDSGQSSTTHQHTWGEWSTIQDATCENKGYKTRTCSGCSKTERENIDAKGHSFGEWETVTESTCTVEGQKKRVCSACNTEETDVIAAKGHTFGESVQTVAPNCTDDGESKKVCTVCKHEETEVIPANGHNYVDYICSVCKAVVAEKAVQTVKIANTSLLLPLNTPVKLDVQVYPADALYTSVTYTIDERNNSCGATITEDGVLSCTQLGSVRIRVTVDNVSSAYVTFNVPTEIRTAEEFDAIRNNLKGYYILCNDIDLSAYSTWTPIGYATKAADGSLSYSGTGFQGEFNGNGYTISGVNIDLAQTNLITVGLFGFVDTSAVVSNVKVEANVVGTASASEYIGTLTGVNYGVVDNCEVTSTVNINGALYVGGIVGQNNGNLIDCLADVSIKASNSNSNGYYVGGIAGQFVIGNMDNNTAKSNIEITSCNFCYVGGITGNAYGSFSGTNCDATIVVSANSSNTISYAGGVVGKVEDSDSEIAFDLNNTTITGSITVKKANKLYVGGIAGYGDIFSNCINDVDITVTSSNNTYVGGVAGKSTKISNSKNNGAISVNSTSTVYVGGIAGNTEILNDVTNYTDVSVTAATAYFGGVAGEAASAQNVYNYCYELSVNASNSATFGGVLGKCTQKIENSYNTANLKVTRSDSGLYLGGIVGDSDTTSNTVKNATNSGKIIVDVSKLSTVYVGGIAGKAASVSDSANSATVISIKANSLSGSPNQMNVGGLCGYSSGSIENSYSYANVTLENAAMSAPSGYKAVVGGLAGTAKNVSGSYATGDVSVSLYNGSVNAGGLLGNLNGTANDSYARGSVTGNTTNEIKIGGLVAYAQSGTNVQNCYAAYNYLTTNITSNGSTAYVGGLVAHNLGTVTDSYAMNYINTIGSGSNDTIYAGGVIGCNNGMVSKSYSSSATEHVLNAGISVDIDCTSNLSANVYVGGFVGYNNKTITNCYAGAEVIGRGCYTGGFVGYQNTNGRISYALALAPVNSGISGQTHTGGFSGNDAGSYTSCIFSTTGTQIAASNGAGGTTVSGIVGKSETELLNTSTLSGFDTSVWTIASGSIPTLTLNNNWKVYNDGYDNFNVLKNVVNPARQYVKVSDFLVEVSFDANIEIDIPAIVIEKGSKISSNLKLYADGYGCFSLYTDKDYTTELPTNTCQVNANQIVYVHFRKIIAIPEGSTYVFNTEQVTLDTIDYSKEYYTVSGIYEATNAGKYIVILTPTYNYCWSSDNADSLEIIWTINKRIVDVPDNIKYDYTGANIVALDDQDLLKYFSVSGNYTGIDIGEYNVILSLKDTKNCIWQDETIENKEITWHILEMWDGSADTSWYNTSQTEFTISTAEEFAGLAQLVNNGNSLSGIKIGLNHNLDLNGYEWIPVGINTTFDGVFNGNGYTIYNFKMSDGNFKNIGVFGANNGIIQNLNVTDFIIDVASNQNKDGSSYQHHKYIGGLVGINTGTIISCFTKGSISSSVTLSSSYNVHIFQYVGGLLGSSSGTVQNCHSAVVIEVISSGYSGRYSSNVYNYVGGLIGSASASVSNCYATQKITSRANSKSNRYTSSDDAYSLHVGESLSYAGGLIGYSSGNLMNCYGTGDIVSESSFNLKNGLYAKYSYNYVGGLVGYGNYKGTIANCYATGDVSSSPSSSQSYAGGLVGYNRCTIANSYATGDVSSSSYAGDLVGYNYEGTITRCYRYSGQSISGNTKNTLGAENSMAELQSVTFQSSTLGWSADDWDFVEGTHPTLKNVGASN